MILLLDIILNKWPKKVKVKNLGKILVPVPYTVKGMDMSFSGILNFFEDIVN
jgi:tRNA A37 threonylcarbamoyltransferase TsaD